jgi:hypothetical protein
MLPERVPRLNADGSDNSLRLFDAFLNPENYNNGGAAGDLTADKAAGAIIRGLSLTVGNEIDEFVTSSCGTRSSASRRTSRPSTSPAAAAKASRR